ncbi:hypothetical protein NUH87_19940 [Pseudomonas batumici]|uniref:DUF4376 domain-containing protein n=1 Tax=Pseudomonas batumici TaxID=226910 RepID=UPI0030D538E9
MTTKTVYQVNRMGVYVGPVTADESPLEPGIFLIPGGCVESAPPEAPEHKAAYWNGRAWQLVEYFEGLVVYNTANREPLTLTGVGPIPNGYTVKKPEPGQIWKYGRWVDDLDTMLAKLYEQKLASINEGCSRYIESGFTSEALGERYRYSSSLEDQVNLYGLIDSELDGLYPAYDSDGKKVFLLHEARQLRQLGTDLVLFKQSALLHAETLKQALAQALADKDLAAMKAIEWSPLA